MIDYPVEECIVCESQFRADGDIESCGQCSGYFCGGCDDYQHEVNCKDSK
jgi:hypothetical protein